MSKSKIKMDIVPPCTRGRKLAPILASPGAMPLPSGGKTEWARTKARWRDLSSLDNELDAVALRIASRLASYASHDRGLFPSISRLSQEVACSDSAARRALSQLVERGWLTRERRGQRDTYRYLLAVNPAVSQPIKNRLEQVRSAFQAGSSSGRASAVTSGRACPVMSGRARPLYLKEISAEDDLLRDPDGLQPCNQEGLFDRIEKAKAELRAAATSAFQKPGGKLGEQTDRFIEDVANDLALEPDEQWSKTISEAIDAIREWHQPTAIHEGTPWV